MAVSSVETDSTVDLPPEVGSIASDPFDATGLVLSIVTVFPGEVALLPSSPVTVAVIT